MIAALTIMETFYRARRDFGSLRGVALLAHQDRRARAIVAHAVANAPAYTRHYRDRDVRAWRTLPTIDKRFLMEQFDEINTRGVSRADAMSVALTAERTRDFRPTVSGLTVGLSTGTSGYRGLFLLDRREQARWVGLVLARVLPPFRVRGYTVTLFSMSGSNLYDDLRGRWLRFHHHDLATPLEDAVRLLNRDQPDILCGPPSYLEALSAQQVAGTLRIAPRKVISVAEVLEPQTARLLEGRFGCRVDQIYQCSEGLVGISCPRGHLHAQDDLVAAQYDVLSAEDGIVTPIITDLWHRTLPIIRYRLGDTVTLASDACACGSAFQVIDTVDGRCDDVCEFRLSDGSLRSIFPGAVRRMVLLASEGITDYDVVQERPSHLRVRVAISPGVSADSVSDAVRRTLAAELEAQGVIAADLDVEIGEAAPQRGKRRRVRRLSPTLTPVSEPAHA